MITGYMVSPEYSSLERIKDKKILEVYEGLLRGERLDRDEALYLFRTEDIFGLGIAADLYARSLHGD